MALICMLEQVASS